METFWVTVKVWLTWNILMPIAATLLLIVVFLGPSLYSEWRRQNKKQ